MTSTPDAGAASPHTGRHVPVADRAVGSDLGRFLPINSRGRVATPARAVFSGEEPKNGSHWSPERREYFRQLAKAGTGTTEIARLMGISTTAVHDARRVYGLRSNAPTVAEQVAQRDQQARDLDALLQQGLSVPHAAQKIGITAKRANKLCARYGLKFATNHAHGRGGSMVPKATRGPGKLTPAQREATDRFRQVSWTIACNKLRVMPPPSREEADRLVAEAIAAGRITICPPAASPEKPMNAGQGWGFPRARA